MNLYAPCAINEKLILSNSIGSVIEQYNDGYVCVVGDFNSIRRANERARMSDVIESRDTRAFDELISYNNLIDLPISGRKYTWYRKNRTCKSKFDRIVVNDLWLIKWPNAILKGLQRGILDHSSIIL